MRVKIKLFIYIIMQGNFSSRFSRIPKNKISIGYCWKKKCLFRSLYLNSVIKSEILEELFHLYCMHEKEASKDDGILNIPCMIVLTVPIRRNKFVGSIMSADGREASVSQLCRFNSWPRQSTVVGRQNLELSEL